MRSLRQMQCTARVGSRLLYCSAWLFHPVRCAAVRAEAWEEWTNEFACRSQTSACYHHLDIYSSQNLLHFNFRAQCELRLLCAAYGGTRAFRIWASLHLGLSLLTRARLSIDKQVFGLCLWRLFAQGTQRRIAAAAPTRTACCACTAVAGAVTSAALLCLAAPSHVTLVQRSYQPRESARGALSYCMIATRVCFCCDTRRGCSRHKSFSRFCRRRRAPCRHPCAGPPASCYLASSVRRCQHPTAALPLLRARVAALVRAARLLVLARGGSTARTCVARFALHHLRFVLQCQAGASC